MAKHNKKRNSGLLYEFLVRSISRAMIENNNDRETIARHLVQKYFKQGTEIHKEFRLINALVNVPVGNENLAHTVIHEARAAANKFDAENLNKEKSTLIREINHKLGSNSVYAESVPNYRDYATAGTILSYWRNELDLDISTVINYEAQIIENLSRAPETNDIENEYDEQIDPLVVKVMAEKLNRKYGSKMTPDQITLIKTYTFAENKEAARLIAESIKEKALDKLNEYLEGKEESEAQKIQEVMELISSQKSDNLDDETLTRFLQMTQIVQEIEENK
jgi:hypothetical protein